MFPEENGTTALSFVFALTIGLGMRRVSSFHNLFLVSRPFGSTNHKNKRKAYYPKLTMSRSPMSTSNSSPEHQPRNLTIIKQDLTHLLSAPKTLPDNPRATTRSGRLQEIQHSKETVRVYRTRYYHLKDELSRAKNKDADSGREPRKAFVDADEMIGEIRDLLVRAEYIEFRV